MNSDLETPIAEHSRSRLSAVSAVTTVCSGTIRLPKREERPERESFVRVISELRIQPNAVGAVLGTFRHVGAFLPHALARILVARGIKNFQLGDAVRKHSGQLLGDLGAGALNPALKAGKIRCVHTGGSRDIG